MAYIIADGPGSGQNLPADRCRFETSLSHQLAIPLGELIQNIFIHGIGKVPIPTSQDGYAILVMCASSIKQALAHREHSKPLLCLYYTFISIIVSCNINGDWLTLKETESDLRIGTSRYVP